MTPIQQRRWQTFKSNRRGYWSLWLFLILFLVSLFSEFIANDKPLLVSYDNQWFFPILQSYPETAFGGEFETEADYRDQFVIDLIEAKGWLLAAPIPYHYNSINYNAVDLPSPPSTENWLGTDDRGRDVLARILYGFRISVLFGLFLTLFSSIIGVAVGALQGYFGGKIDLIGQRVIEIWAGLPVLFILIILSSVVTPNIGWLFLIMLIFSWMTLVGVVRAEFLRGRNFDYVKAARALGVSNRVIMFRHILPNAMVATITYLPFILSGAITTLTSLDFLGLGLPPGSPSLGELLQQGKNNIDSPWLGISAFVTLSLMLSLLIFIGEGVRDAFDPQKELT